MCPSNFLPLSNCEINVILTWSEKFVLTDITTQATWDANPNADPPAEARERIDAPTNATFRRHKIVCSSCYFFNWRW